MLEYPSFSLEGKLSLVTGGSKGIGFGMAMGLAHAGSDVVILGRDEAAGEQARRELEQHGHQAWFVQADVKDDAQVRQAISGIEKNVGAIDILVNNAGKNVRSLVEEYATEDWDDVISTNLRGIFLVGREVLRLMKQRQRGKVINISSVFGGVAMPYQTAYAASKGGIAQITKVWAVELASQGINVNAIAPAYVRTPMTEGWLSDRDRLEQIMMRTPAGRLGEMKDVIGAAVFLASDASDYIHGHTLYVDGGWLAQ